MSVILIFSDNTARTLELANAAGQMNAAEGGTLCAVTVNNSEQANELCCKGIHTYSIDNLLISVADTAGLASALQQAAVLLNADTVLLASDRRGKELAGRLAEAWEAGCLTDVKGWTVEENQLTFFRNALGGVTVATQVFKTPRRVVAVSPKSVPQLQDAGPGSIQPLEVKAVPATVKLLERRAKAGEFVDIQAASRLVVVGQGVENKEHLLLIDKIAKGLEAEVGCSKPVASDKKWFSEDRIVGLSGNTCKPELAIILGVSGQVQFVVGIREAKIIVSVNNDENAYMNKIADYVLTAKVEDVLPELEKVLA